MLNLELCMSNDNTVAFPNYIGGRKTREYIVIFNIICCDAVNGK